MDRIRAADDSLLQADDREQQREMYEKTLRAVKGIDADDDDEGVAVVADWIVEQIETEGKRPSSKAARSRAKRFCREHGYSVPNDSWMGT